MQTSSRNQYIDLIRGLLIFYIVSIIHGFFWLKLFPQAYSSLLLFEMPCIFIVSGYSYYLFESANKTKNPSLSFLAFYKYLITRLCRLIIPYFAYAAVCAVIFIFLEHPNNLWYSTIAWLNPFVYGDGYSFGTANWHLWFIAPFLWITALLPLFSKLRIDIKVPLIIWVIFLTGIIYAISKLNFAYSEIIKNIIFYTLWGYFGYCLAKYKGKFEFKDYIFVFVFALLILLIAKFIIPNRVDMNMQNNKFPPNHTFFLFSSIWVSVLLALIKLAGTEIGSFFLKIKLLRYFTSYGYSIYLWQGLGYTAAIQLQVKLNLNLISTWLIAIILSTALGILASPLERIKIRL